MAAKDLGPLDWQVAIVDNAGRPSPEFQRRWNTQRNNNGLIGLPGGTPGQVQFNNAGAFGGFTVSGDGALNTATGVLIVTKTNGVTFAPSATIDTTNAANISSGTLPDARLSSNVPLKNAANTFTGQNTQQITGGGINIFAVNGEGVTRLQAQRSSNDANSANLFTLKSRGTIATPLTVATGDNLFSLVGQGYGSSAYVSSAALMFVCIDPTPSNTAMGTQIQCAVCPSGSSGRSTLFTMDFTSGFVFNGVTLCNGSGVLQVPASGVTAGSYTSANITVGADGRVTAAANGSGGSGGFDPFGVTRTKPTAAGLTLSQNANTGGLATLTNLTSRGVQLKVPDNTHNGHNTASAGVAGPSNTAATWTANLHRNFLGAQGGGTFGIYMKDGAGKFLFIGFYEGAGGAPQFYMGTMSALGTFTANVWATTLNYAELPAVPFWLKMQITGGNLVSSYSVDGEGYEQLDSRTIASLSAQFNGTLSEVGFFDDTFDGNLTSPGNQGTHFLNCYSFTASTP